jgi:hypothetical protein
MYHKIPKVICLTIICLSIQSSDEIRKNYLRVSNHLILLHFHFSPLRRTSHRAVWYWAPCIGSISFLTTFLCINSLLILLTLRSHLFHSEIFNLFQYTLVHIFPCFFKSFLLILNSVVLKVISYFLSIVKFIIIKGDSVLVWALRYLNFQLSTSEQINAFIFLDFIVYWVSIFEFLRILVLIRYWIWASS